MSDVDFYGNCARCGGVHYGTGSRCVYEQTLPAPVAGEKVPVSCRACGYTFGAASHNDCAAAMGREIARLRNSLTESQADFDAACLELGEWRRRAEAHEFARRVLHDMGGAIKAAVGYNGPADGDALLAAVREVVDERDALRARLSEVERNLAQRTAWQRCTTHGEIRAADQWGCPDCVAELRQRVAALERRALAAGLRLP